MTLNNLDRIIIISKEQESKIYTAHDVGSEYSVDAFSWQECLAELINVLTEEENIAVSES